MLVIQSSIFLYSLIHLILVSDPLKATSLQAERSTAASTWPILWMWQRGLTAMLPTPSVPEVR